MFRHLADFGSSTVSSCQLCHHLKPIWLCSSFYCLYIHISGGQSFPSLEKNETSFLSRELQELSELVLSKEMVNYAAVFRAKVDSRLLFAYNLTFGKYFKLFFNMLPETLY